MLASIIGRSDGGKFTCLAAVRPTGIIIGPDLVRPPDEHNPQLAQYFTRSVALPWPDARPATGHTTQPDMMQPEYLPPASGRA